jgi:hypothetical protein
MEFAGFREKQTGGVFGSWKTTQVGTEDFTGSGNFNIKPAEQDKGENNACKL